MNIQGKGPIITLFIILQIGLIGGGVHYYSGKNAPTNKVPWARSSNQANNKHVSYVDTKKDKHTAQASNVKANVKPKNYGSYIHTIPPLDKTLRRYYMIDVMVNIRPKHIYQQFVITPTKKNVPTSVQKRLDKSSLLRAVRHYNSVSYQQGRAKNFNRIKSDKIYNQKNEQYHFIHTNPFVLPPIGSNKPKANITFTKNGLNSHGYHFNKISNRKAEQIIAEGRTNPHDVGY